MIPRGSHVSPDPMVFPHWPQMEHLPLNWSTVYLGPVVRQKLFACMKHIFLVDVSASDECFPSCLPSPLGPTLPKKVLGQQVTQMPVWHKQSQRAAGFPRVRKNRLQKAPFQFIGVIITYYISCSVLKSTWHLLQLPEIWRLSIKNEEEKLLTFRECDG